MKLIKLLRLISSTLVWTEYNYIMTNANKMSQIICPYCYDTDRDLQCSIMHNDLPAYMHCHVFFLSYTSRWKRDSNLSCKQSTMATKYNMAMCKMRERCAPISMLCYSYELEIDPALLLVQSDQSELQPKVSIPLWQQFGIIIILE